VFGVGKTEEMGCNQFPEYFYPPIVSADCFSHFLESKSLDLLFDFRVPFLGVVVILLIDCILLAI
jgi:hypothetical protein